MCRKITIVAAMIAAVLAVSPSLFAQGTQVQGMAAELNQISNVGGTTLNRSSVDADAAAAAKAKSVADASATAKVDNSNSGNSQNDNSNVNSNDSGGGTGVSVVSLTQRFPDNEKPNMQAPVAYPPYLGMWTHGGWGTLRLYFPNGPATDAAVYERQFNPSDFDDMRDLRGVISSMPHKGPLEVLGAIFNPDGYHYGRGVRLLGNSLVRNRRPEGKPLAVINITGVEKGFLKDHGYVYVGTVSMEGDANRNWDQVEICMVQETLRWDVDIVLLNGGMKGITAGSTNSNGGAGAAGQPNYSFSVFGATSKGVTEPKGKAMVSGEGYRLDSKLVAKRGIKVGHYSDLIALRAKSETEAKARAEAEAKAAAQKAAEENQQRQNGNGDKKKEQQQLQSKPPVR